MVALLPILTLTAFAQVRAEARREGGEDVLRKAQYMIRQLNQEKGELQKQVADLQAELDDVRKQQAATDAHLAKSRHNNERLVERVQSDVEKFKVLVERYRTVVKTLRQANSDNQYLVKAVQEREQWIKECRDRNEGMFEANTDLLARYKKAATWFSEPITGLSKVSVENETQEYRFKLEDLKVTRFQSDVEVAPHVRKAQEGLNSEKQAPSQAGPALTNRKTGVTR
jgi:chromosome segregation ATPase